ncbi:nitrite reductase large subunit NirB [Agarilytica rhodophyticola]|uniref:nitrite reductase large subunit NirB n=1 Tax=Agarilytica rhodophyticola TaxID=1737490 RepID=UPI000B341F83|nr:nitrite reductase large subunit NirB [Agarilytica rhodophyticola]
MNKTRIVVVGNGMVGHKFIENFLAHENSESYDIVTFSEEPRLAYDRVQLSAYFSGSSAEDLMLTSQDYYRENGVNYILNDKVVELKAAEKKVITEHGREEHYDKLVLATGSYPFVPPIPGNDQPHCLVYRTIEDLEAMKDSSKESRVGVVVGGGLLGLEAANALKNLGLEVHVVEFAPRLMAIQLDQGGGDLLRQKIEALGVNVHTEKNTKEIVAGENCRYSMNFADGSKLETDMILFSAGIRPQDELARQFNIETGERGGIVINDNCQTSVEDIYAIGECALWRGKIFGLVAPGYQMAKVAVSHITGGSEVFTGADMSTKLKLLGVDVASIGDAHGRTADALNYVYQDGVNEIYKRLVVSKDGKKLLGAVLVGDAEAYGNLQQMCVHAMDLPDMPEALILPTTDGAQASVGTDALPDEAHICTCHEVTKGQICEAVAQGANNIGELKSCTKAGTGCGGCVALATQVLNAELTKLGVQVNTDLCEHFAHTRQELYHIVRVEKIKTFDELIAKHGKGLGCDICKPTVGSILASCWNDYVLKDEHAGLQDTNDYFMANMQKNGTYSIVPRIAAGEITPDKLIVLGQVAKKYNLYTKITGGQRIDLFGAQQHELPSIWQELVDAGFETGHAYGKSLRTVKSCVGSTWCRYGVLDSMSMAIKVENRYKGLRAPHKIKFAVSGCTRECAEAQSKDVGIIATENGWSLYVCGNGGMKPRHADLFATGLDDETLIKYIDRFLMFYIRTADRLQRTSVWMNNLEGGLDYLKSVVVDDKLELCHELESDMNNIVDTYQCEWKTTINDPEKVKRFRTFVNSDQKDSTVVFVEEREQIRPATDEEIVRLVDIDKDDALQTA